MKLTWDEVRVASRMRERGASVRRLAKDLGVTEAAVRYRLKRSGAGDQRDGRRGKATALDGYEEAVEAIQERLGDGRLDGEGRPGLSGIPRVGRRPWKLRWYWLPVIA